jgi:hypothetical protein
LALNPVESHEGCGFTALSKATKKSIPKVIEELGSLFKYDKMVDKFVVNWAKRLHSKKKSVVNAVYKNSVDKDLWMGSEICKYF